MTPKKVGRSGGRGAGAKTSRVTPDRLGNVTALEGCSRCYCGCKYWEHDRCIDCGTQHHPDHDKET